MAISILKWEGFEDGTKGIATTAGTVTIVTSPVITGIYSGKPNLAAADNYLSLAATTGKWYFHFRIRFSAFPPSTQLIFGGELGTTIFFQVIVDSGGLLRMDVFDS